MENNINLTREITHGVIIHNDAGYLSGSGYRYLEKYNEQQLARGFAHYYVSKNDVYQFWDDSKVAWHTGNFSGNTEYIGIEVTNSYGPVGVFSENEQETFKLVAKLLKKYGLEPSRETVRLHREFKETSCPHRSWELHGQDVDKVKDYFIQEIKKYYGGGVDMAQKAIFPMTYINVTQGPNGNFSHQGLQAIDLAGKDSGIDQFVAPFDVKVIKKFSDKGTANGTGVLFQSTQPILLTDGTESIIHFIAWHDNNTSDIAVGGVYKQGVHVYDEGTAGFATGNHVHVEFGRGQAPSGYPLERKSTGQWGLPNAIAPHLVLTYNDGNVLVGSKLGGVPFVKDSGQAPAPAQTTSANGFVSQKATARVTAKGLNVRKAPSTSAPVVEVLPQGKEFAYDGYVDAEGIRWIRRASDGAYVARRVLGDNGTKFADVF